jgi:hypothetical protein
MLSSYIGKVNRLWEQPTESSVFVELKTLKQVHALVRRCALKRHNSPNLAEFGSMILLMLLCLIFFFPIG